MRKKKVRGIRRCDLFTDRGPLKSKKNFSRFFKKDADEEVKDGLVKQICQELTVHARVEEEIFYPAVRAASADEHMMDEADVEHDGVKDLVAQLEVMEASDDHYDARVTVLGEYVGHHVKEEEGKMFPAAKKAKLDTKKLVAQIEQRKEELMAELKISPAARAKSPAAHKIHARRPSR
jgi:hemerythrin superfamily protein